MGTLRLVTESKKNVCSDMVSWLHTEPGIEGKQEEGAGES